MVDQSSLLAVVAVQWMAMLALGAGPAIVVWRWTRLPPVFLPLYAWASTAMVAFATFFLWLFSRTAAITTIRAACAASLIVAALALRHGEAPRRALRGFLVSILMLPACWGVLLVLEAVPTDARARFTVALPSDNALPRYFADRLYAPNATLTAIAAPIEGSYLTSDRPPLQTGMVLATWALLPGYRFSTYQVAGTLCQLGWIPALCCLIATLKLSRWERRFVLIAVACSGFVLLNSVYVWPKLLSAWLFIGGLATLLFDEAPHPVFRARTLTGAALIGLSLMAHGGIAFSVLALPVLIVPAGGRRRVLTWHTLASCAIVLAIVSPWLAYQRYVDPPGNRLLKMHLAGIEPVDGRGVLESVLDQYSSTPIATLVETRLTNLQEQWLTPHGTAGSNWRAWLQWQQFFHQVPALDLLSFGLLIVLLAPRLSRREARTGGRPLEWRLAVYAATTWAVWILVMFQPHSALVHQGSYGNTVLLLTLGAIGLSRLPAPLGVTLLAGHVGLFAFTWLGISTPVVTPRPAWLYAGITVFALFVVAGTLLPDEAFDTADITAPDAPRPAGAGPGD